MHKPEAPEPRPLDLHTKLPLLLHPLSLSLTPSVTLPKLPDYRTQHLANSILALKRMGCKVGGHRSKGERQERPQSSIAIEAIAL